MKEHLVLYDCGIDANRVAKSYQMMYYKGNPWDSKNNWIRADMVAEVPKDGSYPWRTTGVSAKFINGDTFTVRIDPAIRDYDAKHFRLAGDASHTYDEKNLDCYGSHKPDKYTLDDGTKCSSTYICNPFMKGPPEKSVRTTSMSFSNMNVDVQDYSAIKKYDLLDPKAAFKKAAEDIADSQCNGQPTYIGGGCTIKYDCTFVDPAGFKNRTSGKALGNLLTQTAGKEIAKTITEWKQSAPRHPTNFHRKYTYPQNGQVMTTTGKLDDPEGVAPQSWIKWAITCEDDVGACGKTCESLTDAVNIASLGFPPLAILGTIMSAVCDKC